MSASSVASLTSLVEPKVPGSIGTASAVAAAAEDRVVRPLLPARADLAALLPAAGLTRGSTVAVDGSTTLLLILLATASAKGSWAAVVGLPDLGLLAAREIGVAPHRLALVPDPGAELATVVAALLDGIDLVVVAADRLVRDGAKGQAMARRLTARARSRGAVLIPFGTGGWWPTAELRLSATDHQWTGIGDGHGYLTTHTAVVTVRGRGSAVRPIQARLTLQTCARDPSPGERLQPHGAGSPASRWATGSGDLVPSSAGARTRVPLDAEAPTTRCEATPRSHRPVQGNDQSSARTR